VNCHVQTAPAEIQGFNPGIQVEIAIGSFFDQPVQGRRQPIVAEGRIGAQIDRLAAFLFDKLI